MHELTKYGLCEIYSENWMDTEKYNHLPMHMEVVERALKSGEELDWFLEYINGYYETVTMVSFESVKAQLNLLGIDLAKVANQAFYEKNGVEKTRDRMKRCLNELFYRRNIIAHQTDRAHTDARRYPITKEIVQRFIRDVGKIVEAIHMVFFHHFYHNLAEMFFYYGIVDRMLLLGIICQVEEQGAESVRLNKGFCRNFEDTAALHKWKLLFIAELCLGHFL